MKRKILFVIAIVAVALAAFLAYQSLFKAGRAIGFQVDTVVLKIAVRENSTLDTYVRVSNFDTHLRVFEAEITYLEGFVSIDESSFEVEPGETEKIKVILSNLESSPPGIYLGKLVVSSEGERAIVPIIIEIESEDILFDTNFDLFPADNIFSGSKISSEIKIFDLSNIGTANVELRYFVKDFNGKTIIEGSESPVVKNQVLITKSFDLPSDLALGDYVFGVVLTYKNSVGTSSYLFSVISPKGPAYIFNDGIYLILFLIAIVVIFVIFVIYSIYSRDLLAIELKNQYEQELVKQENWLVQKQKENEELLKTDEELALNRKMFSDVKKKRRSIINKVHEKRVRQINHLKKINHLDEIKKQISQWNRKGYDTALLESRVKVPSVKDIKRQVEKWKRQGYNTSVLEGN